MAQDRPPRPDEIRAMEIVCRATSGTSELLDRHPLQGVADYRLRLPDRPAGVLEITSHGDPLRINLGKQMDRGGWTHQASRLNRFWSVHLPPIRRTDDRLPYRYVDLLENLPALEDLLSEFEMTGVLDVGPWEPSSQYERLRALGVESAQGLNNGEPSINVLPPGGGGGSGPGAVAGAVQVELAKEDNRRKLSKGPYPENDGETVRPFPAHLFVWVSPSAVLPFLAIADGKPPADLESVPSEVTDVWVAAQLRTGEIVWHWNANGWAAVNGGGVGD